jgi:hypothetical protein
MGAGRWTPSEIAWVQFLPNADPPHRWCSRPAGATRSSLQVDAAALAAIIDAVDLYGVDADDDDAHALESPGLHHRRRKLAIATPSPASRPPRPSGSETFEPSHNRKDH